MHYMPKQRHDYVVKTIVSDVILRLANIPNVHQSMGAPATGTNAHAHAHTMRLLHASMMQAQYYAYPRAHGMHAIAHRLIHCLSRTGIRQPAHCKWVEGCPANSHGLCEQQHLEGPHCSVCPRGTHGGALQHLELPGARQVSEEPPCTPCSSIRFLLCCLCSNTWLDGGPPCNGRQRCSWKIASIAA